MLRQYRHDWTVQDVHMTSREIGSLSDVLDLHPLAHAAWRAGWAAGAFLRDERPSVLQVDTKSSPTDAVTVMDRRAESMIFTALLADRPDDGTLGEEGGQRSGTSGTRWIVDPLDGTVNYLYGLPLWGVSIAAEVQGVMTVGVVILPEVDEAFVGILGEGAWRIAGGQAHRLRSTDRTVLGESLVSTGFGYDAQRRRAQGAVVAGVLPLVRDVRRTGCAVADLCWLAAGRLDAHYERGLNPWDVAAGGLIAAEAGAIVTGIAGGEVAGLVIASAPGISEELSALLSQLGADQD
jgi:myo-inositol-1(or 4)-monophosphatase